MRGGKIVGPCKIGDGPRQPLQSQKWAFFHIPEIGFEPHIIRVRSMTARDRESDLISMQTQQLFGIEKTKEEPVLHVEMIVDLLRIPHDIARIQEFETQVSLL